MSFPLFSNLPQEIQDQIWASAIPRLPPTAHLVKLKTQRWGANPNRSSPRTQTALHRVYDPDVPEPPFTVDATRDAIRVLYASCRASRAVTQRISRATEIKTTLLRPSIPTPEAADDPTLPPLRVNVATDLIILDPSWHRRIPVYLPVTLGRARYMAQAFPDSDLTGTDTGADFGKLMNLYYDLVVAYVLIEPGDLVRARETSWPNDSEGLDTLEGFVAAYDGGSQVPGPWIRGGREYYEIPKEHVRQLGGLRWVVDILEATRLQKLESEKLDYDAAMDRSKYSTRHRLMSWREVYLMGRVSNRRQDQSLPRLRSCSA